MIASIELPLRRKQGRPSKESEQEYERSLMRFSRDLIEVQKGIDFHMSARGWCYYLEGVAGLEKGEFQWAADRIQKAREQGYLPPGFISDEDSRMLTKPSDWGVSVDEYVQLQYDTWREAENTFRNCGDAFEWVSFWEHQDVYLQLFVEKVDLKTLFEKQCSKYRIPCANIKGHGSLEQKAAAAANFQAMEARGKQVVLLVCADFDPAGLCISGNQLEGFHRLSEFTGWDPSNLIIDRFGLNYDFIEANGLSWIDNLMTSSGKDLSDPSHQFYRDNVFGVREYIAQYGARKCEANAVVVKSQMGRQMLQDTIDKWLGPDAYELHQERLEAERERVNELVGVYLEGGQDD